MSILTSKPPKTVTIRGAECAIETDFRPWIRFETLALSGAGAWELLDAVYPRPVSDPAAALEAALWFYRCGRDLETEATGEAAYDFEQDAGEIMASFSAAYGIDLSTAEMHWWTFRALMAGLPEDTVFARLLYIRTADTDEMSDGERRRLMRLRGRFALKKQPMTLDERNARWLAAARGEKNQAPL